MLLATTPTGVERPFPTGELIVTKTDLQGRITYANDVFCRMSAYDEADMIGRPHSIVRHPEMPRGVFSLLWSTIAAGEEIFAYVVNLASDGAHYWVFAHVTPRLDSSGRLVGYHSNRRPPQREALARVQPVYRAMREAESRYSKATEAAAAGLAYLESLLGDAGMTYDEWVWAVTNGDKS